MSGDVKLAEETSFSIGDVEDGNPYCENDSTEHENLASGKNIEEQNFTSNHNKGDKVKLHVRGKHISFAKDDISEKNSHSKEGNETVERSSNQHGDEEIQGDQMQLLEGERLMPDMETKEDSALSPEDEVFFLIQNKAEVHRREGPISTLSAKSRQSSTRSRQSSTRSRQSSTRSRQSSTRSQKNLSFCKRLHKHRTFRRKVIRTAWLLGSFVILGWVVAQIGPSLPDLMYLYDLKLHTVSWLFTTHSAGYIVGSLIAGILYDKWNRLLLLFFSVLGIAMTTSAWPWCVYFELMAVIRFLDGVFCGSLDTGGNTEVAALWREEGRPYMQALHFAFALGGILAPMVTEPFMTPSSFADLHKVKEISVEDLYVQSKGANNSHVNNTGFSLTLGIIDSFFVVPNISDPTMDRSDTHIQYSFLLSGLLAFIASIPFIVMYYKYRNRLVLMDKPKPDFQKKKLQGWKILALAFIALMFFFYYSIVESLGAYIMLFCISELEFNKVFSSLATSVYWAAFGLGRFSGIFIIRCCSPTTMIITFSVFVICSLGGLIMACIFKIHFLIWLFIVLSGLSTSVIFPTLFTWTEENVEPVNGKISSLFLISASFGMMVHPIFLGYMMEKYTPLWLLYVLVGESAVCLLLYVVLIIVCKRYVIKPGHTFAEMEIHVKT